VGEGVDAGWEALSRGAWDEAVVLLREREDDPEALEALGVAHWWLDDADATFAVRECAYRLYQERADRLGAARVACALAWDSVLFGGRTAVAAGWLERATRLLDDEVLCAEHAWLAVRAAEVALATGEPSVAGVAAQRAIAIAEQLALEDVQVVGRSLEGLSLVHEGLVDEGMRRLDESAVAATAGDVKDLMWVGKVCCNLIAACERVGDVERATEWCAQVKEFAGRWELQTLFNVCRTQYATVLLQTGDWTEAESELTTALAVFSGGRRGALVNGTAQLGELRRRQGRLNEARALFAQSEASWAARLGGGGLPHDEGVNPAPVRRPPAASSSRSTRVTPRQRSRSPSASSARPTTAAGSTASPCSRCSRARPSRPVASTRRVRRRTSSTAWPFPSGRLVPGRRRHTPAARARARAATSSWRGAGSRTRSICSHCARLRTSAHGRVSCSRACSSSSVR
jgi:hypothetical protein